MIPFKLHACSSLIMAACTITCGAAQAETDLTARPVEVRFGYERLQLPGSETMGLVGGSYLLQIAPETVPGLLFGPAAYGAITGQRGGFFTGGAELAWKKPLFSRLSLETGLYVGGGGGGAAAVGGGLMLRPHIDLMWKFKQVSAGISASEVRFPNGSISSKQLGLVVAIDDSFLFSSPSGIGQELTIGQRGGIGFDRISLVGGGYQANSGVRNLAGAAYSGKLGYAGFRADNVYWGVESGAAVRGSADGYAEVLGLIGAEYPLGANSRIGARVALGMGGGGKVPVGGGALAKAGVYAKTYLSRDLYVALEGGLVDAPNGSFKAKYLNLQLGLDLDSRLAAQRNIRGMDWEATGQHYLNAARYSGERANLDTLGLKINRNITERTYFSAQAHSAFSGHAGGYSVGLVGLGARTAFGGGFGGGAEVLAGAGGGGGVASNGGALAQALAYASYDIGRSARIKLGLGRVHSFKGALDSNLIDLSLSFPLGVPGK